MRQSAASSLVRSKLVSALVASILSIVAGPSQAAAVYTYVGTAFIVKEPANAPAPLGSHMSATLTFAAPLPASAVGYCLGTGCATPQPIFWDVDIGIGQHLRSDNAGFPANFAPLINASSLSTDALGNIVAWSLEFDELNASSIISQFGVLSSVISNTIAGTPVFDAGGVGSGLGEATWGSISPGLWTSVPSVAPLPATGWLVLMGFVAMLTRRAMSRP